MCRTKESCDAISGRFSSVVDGIDRCDLCSVFTDCEECNSTVCTKCDTNKIVFLTSTGTCVA